MKTPIGLCLLNHHGTGVLLTVLFDVDGTIAGTTKDKTDIMRRIGRKYGFPIEIKDYLEAFQRIIDNRKINSRVPIFEEVVGDRKIAEKIAEEYNKESLECMHIYSDAKDVLDNLPGKKGLVTNGPKDIQWGKIRKIGVEKHFDTIVVSGEVGKSKPNSEIFEIALNSLDSNANECIYVGDVPKSDVLGAKNAGLVSTLINRNGDPPDIKPDYEIKDLREIYGIIDRLGE